AVKPAATKESDPREVLIDELTRAATGAAQIAAGARRAVVEVGEMLDDPVGRHALDRLLITPRTVAEHPDLLKSFAAYVSPARRPARTLGIIASGGDNEPELRRRARDHPRGRCQRPARRAARLERALLSVRAASSRRRRLQRLPDAPPP